jgi:hypothetical protein
MRLAPPTTAAHAGPIGDLIGKPVIRATFADNGGVTRDVTALHVIGGTSMRYASVDDAVRGAKLYMRVTPSKQLGDLAIAVVRDADLGKYRLLELDQTLASWEEPHDWWEATSWTPLDDRIEAVVHGWLGVVPRG